MKRHMLNRLKYGNDFPTIIDWLIDNNISFELLVDLLVCDGNIMIYKEKNLYSYINLKQPISKHKPVPITESEIIDIVKLANGI